MNLDMYSTAALGVVALLVGYMLNNAVPVLKRFCIPSPVTGGLLFSIVTLLLYRFGNVEFNFDGTLKDATMTLFFASVGFQTDFSMLRKGGRSLVVMVLLVFFLVVVQNVTGVALSKLLDINPLVGIAAGSVSLCGGHGTAAGFSGLLLANGLDGAAAIALSAATFGIVAGSLVGGPLADRLISRKSLSASFDEVNPDSEPAGESSLYPASAAIAVFSLVAAAGIGSIINSLLSLTGISFPLYFGALITAVILRNVSEAVPSCPKFNADAIVSVGSICLKLFLGMAMVSLKLWELSAIALPLFVVLVVQLLICVLFARFIAFPLLGRDYDSAVLVSGLCGFGLGATPNAMANMSAVCSKYSYSAMPFVIVPIVGGMFVDIINISVITLFINILK